MERWIPVKGFPTYSVSSEGRVRNNLTGRILKPGKTNGYLQVVLCDSDGHHPKYVHDLVADAFFDGDHEELEVNHDDGIKSNNFVGNLVWSTRSENIKHAFRTGLKCPSGPYSQRKVRIVETGEEFESISACARYIGGDRTHISDCLDGKLKTHKGYHFEEIL